MPVFNPLVVLLTVFSAIALILVLLFLAAAFIVSITPFGDYDNDPHGGLLLDGEDFDNKATASQRR
jgi:hypothetical protein